MVLYIFKIILSINVIIAILTLGDKLENKTKIPETFEEKFEQFNFTKRPLNLYISENGKHVVLFNKTLNDIIPFTSNGSLIDYRIGKPPFLIKNRGSILLLHNDTSKHIL